MTHLVVISRLGRIANVFALASVVLVAGCEGEFVPPGGSMAGPSNPPPPGELRPAPVPETRFARLTHQEWQNSVVDLLGLDAADPEVAGLAAFRPDPGSAGYLFDNNGQTMVVDDALWGAYRSAAADAARLTTADATLLEALAPSGGGDEMSRARMGIEDLARRGYRRPVEAAEVDALMGLYTQGRDAYPDQSGFASGMRLVIEAILQSPHFLYRVELGTMESDSRIALSGYEIASRLSFALWDTMPDQALFAAAASGELSSDEGLRSQAERLLADDRAVAVVRAFHAQLLNADTFSGIMPSTTVYPDAPDELATLAREEHDRVIEDAYRSDAGFHGLLTQTHTFANEALAAVYGATGASGEDFVRVELDPEQRAGILTQVGFLASNATSVDPDPIHRGVFLAERIACLTIGTPPGMIPPLPAPMGRTNREVLESHTEEPGSVCASCHTTLINPFGFPFENYDAVGQWRDEDRGFPVDAEASPLVGGEPTPVMGAVDLAHALSEDESTHACYAEHWIQYLFGRPSAEGDAALEQNLGTGSYEGGSIRELILELITSEAFRTRSVEELP